MHIYEKISKDFYNLCNLPIAVYDLNLIKQSDLGYEGYFDDIIKENKVLNYFNLENKDFKHLKFKDDLNFILTKISRFNTYRGYFLIGPFNSFKKNILPFKEENSIIYIPNIISNISDTIFSKGLSNNKFSLHTRRAIYYVHENYSKEIDIDNLTKILSINKSYFCKIFKKETGFTFSNFLNNYRVEKSKSLLKNTDRSLLEIALAVGFNTQNYYSSVFKKFNSITPIQYRNK